MQFEHSKSKSHTKNFSVIPLELEKENKLVIPNNDTLTIKNSRKPSISPSPAKSTKKIRLHSTPKKLEFLSTEGYHYSDQNEEDDLETSFANISLHDPVEIDSDEEGKETKSDSEIETLINLLPTVLENLRECGQVQSYMKFHELVAEGKMPLTNIAYLLFLDVVDWYSLEDTRTMRYSDNIKWFWKIGMKLFKGKFLRFMSGMKSKGQCINTCESFDPALSSINFAVPNRNCLEDSNVSKELRDVKPGILLDMIKLVHDDGVLQQSYKVSFDGKKVNSGIDSTTMGDINLWGYEGPPTLTERQTEYNSNVTQLEELENLVSQSEARDLSCMSYAFPGMKEKVVDSAKKSLLF